MKNIILFEKYPQIIIITRLYNAADVEEFYKMSVKKPCDLFIGKKYQTLNKDAKCEK